MRCTTCTGHVCGGIAIWLLADTDKYEKTASKLRTSLSCILLVLRSARSSQVILATPTLAKRHSRSNEKNGGLYQINLIHSKHPLKKHFRQILLMAGSGQVPKLRNLDIWDTETTCECRDMETMLWDLVTQLCRLPLPATSSIYQTPEAPLKSLKKNYKRVLIP